MSKYLVQAAIFSKGDIPGLFPAASKWALVHSVYCLSLLAKFYVWMYVWFMMEITSMWIVPFLLHLIVQEELKSLDKIPKASKACSE